MTVKLYQILLIFVQMQRNHVQPMMQLLILMIHQDTNDMQLGINFTKNSEVDPKHTLKNTLNTKTKVSSSTKSIMLQKGVLNEVHGHRENILWLGHLYNLSDQFLVTRDLQCRLLKFLIFK